MRVVVAVLVACLFVTTESSATQPSTAADLVEIASSAAVAVSGHTSVWAPNHINDGKRLRSYNGWLEFERESPWVQLDLSSECSVVKLVIYPAVNPGAGRPRAEDFIVGEMTILASSDGFASDVRNLGHFRHPEHGTQAALASNWVVELTTPTQCRALRFIEMRALRASYVGIGELEVWGRPLTQLAGEADYDNGAALVYSLGSGAKGSDAMAAIAERIAGGLASRGIEELIGSFGAQAIGKLGALFLTFVMEIPNVGTPTEVDLGVMRGGDFRATAVALCADPRGSGGSEAVLPVITVSPGDCINAPTTVRLQRKVGLLRWHTVWETNLLSFEEHMMLSDERIIRIAQPFVVVGVEPVRVSERGTYRLVACSWCDTSCATLLLSF